MRDITTTLYHFDELPTEKAREKAREWWRVSATNDYPWMDDAVESIKAFCAYFDIQYSGYDLNDCRVSFSFTLPDDIADHFSHINTLTTDRDYMPTGYYLDCDLWQTFYDKLREHGRAFKAFDEAVAAAEDAIAADMDYQQTDEYVDEVMTINDYEFTEDGSFY